MNLNLKKGILIAYIWVIAIFTVLLFPFQTIENEDSNEILIVHKFIGKVNPTLHINKSRLTYIPSQPAYLNYLGKVIVITVFFATFYLILPFKRKRSKNKNQKFKYENIWDFDLSYEEIISDWEYNESADREFNYGIKIIERLEPEGIYQLIVRMPLNVQSGENAWEIRFRNGYSDKYNIIGYEDKEGNIWSKREGIKTKVK